MTRLLLALLLAAPPISAVAQAPLAPAPQAEAQPEEENALKYLAQARAVFKPYAYTAKMQPPSGEAARRAIEENAAVFPFLERAVALPLRFEPEKLEADSVQMKARAGARDVARLLALRCSVQTEAGDFAGALRSGLLCIALGLKLQEDGGAVAALTGYAVEGIGLEAMERLAPKWDTATLKSAARGLDAVEMRRPPFSVVLASENESWANLWHQVFQMEALAINGYDKATQDRLLAALREASEQDDALFLHGFPLTRGLDFELDDNEPAPDGKLPIVDANFDAQAWAESLQESARSFKHTTLFLCARVQAKIALLQVALAARAYQIEKKTPPASLQVLVPEYLPSLPDDPFEVGAPLQFKNDGAGLRIYSIGPDGMDDGGQPIQNVGDDGQPTASKNVIMASQGDVLAPPELLKP